MPCYDCSMLGYSATCTSCSPFIAGTPATTPSSPANQSAFKFDFSMHLANIFPVTEPPLTPKYSITAIEQPRPRWTDLEAAEPSTKTSRFNWSEMGFSKEQNTFENLTTSSVSPGFNYDKPCSECPVCSLVPYGALCTNCNQIQTSKATSSPTAWPTTNTLGNKEGSKTPEEELLQTLDRQLFEQINVPHELDESGRRIYDDSGNRLLYYQDEDENTVIGYEAWYPSSVIDDCGDPRDRCANSQVHDAAAEYEVSCASHDVCARPIITGIDDYRTVISGYETWYSCAEIIEDEQEEPLHDLIFEHCDSVSMVEFEQQRFAEFIAAQDDELPQFSSDRERIAAWIATAYVAAEEEDEEDEGEGYVSFWDLEGSDVGFFVV